ncbi:hypothetical protein FVEN_g12808 [Fusarium venenatum]|nr:hypothetical protein FVEN_g12808 [Fusarium venenatum]
MPTHTQDARAIGTRYSDWTAVAEANANEQDE